LEPKEVKTEKNLLNRIRGWFPENKIEGALKQTKKYPPLSRKRLAALITAGSLAVIGGFFLFVIVGFLLNPIVPADTKIIDTIIANRDSLLSVDGVVGAGIERNQTNNYIIGIAVYVDNNTDTAQIPLRLGGFTVFVVNNTVDGSRNLIISRDGS
jgi:hypothetical protein